jgi:hypothetical protein
VSIGLGSAVTCAVAREDLLDEGLENARLGLLLVVARHRQVLESLQREEPIVRK